MNLKNIHKRKSGSPQDGFVLITGLIFLVVLTLVITFALSTSKLEFKMSKNAAENLRAFNNSEGARTVSVKAFQDYAFKSKWSSTTPEPNLTVVNTTRNFITAEPVGELLTDHSTIEDPDGDTIPDPHLTYSLNGQTTNLYIIRTGVTPCAGCSFANAVGYQGAGSGAAAGGVFALYELRADGQAADSAESMTASDLRYFVLN